MKLQINKIVNIVANSFKEYLPISFNSTALYSTFNSANNALIYSTNKTMYPLLNENKYSYIPHSDADVILIHQNDKITKSCICFIQYYKELPMTVHYVNEMASTSTMTLHKCKTDDKITMTLQHNKLPYTLVQNGHVVLLNTSTLFLLM